MRENRNNTEIVELIKKVRDGDQFAFEELLIKYKPMLDHALFKFSRDESSRAHEDDLRQEAILFFYNAILNYDLDIDGVEFGLYAKICVTNGLITQVKHLNKMRAEQLFAVIDNADDTFSAEPSEHIIEEESLARIDVIIRKNLSEFEYKVWCLYASGKTAKAVGEIVGKSEKSVANAIYRIRKKLRDCLND